MRNIASYKLALFDLDGTVYQGDAAIPGAVDLIEFLRSKGVRVGFLTNNSALAHNAIARKVRALGIACEDDDVWSVGCVAASYCCAHNINNVYVCGTDDFRQEIESKGIRVVNSGQADYMVVGFDPHATYEDCAVAVQVALRKDYLVANRERVYPSTAGVQLPGCGAMAAAIAWCAGKEPSLVIGKPNIEYLANVVSYYKTGREEIVLVGDSAESDIAMADAFGCDSVYVGESNPRAMQMRELLDITLRAWRA